MFGIPILIFPPARAPRGLFSFAVWLLKKLPALRADLNLLKFDPERYVVAFFLSSLIWALLITFPIFIVRIVIPYHLGVFETEMLALPFVVFAAFFAIFVVLHFVYPCILVRKAAEQTDRMLTHVLRDMWIQAGSGIPLTAILQNVAAARYGLVSEDIKATVREISAGESERAALEKLAMRTRSEAFRRALWHITAAMRTGVGLVAALESTLAVHISERHRAVREYGAKLNFHLLLFLLFAAVIPAIATVFLSLLSVFGILAFVGAGMNWVIALSLFVQFALVGLMQLARPEVG